MVSVKNKNQSLIMLLLCVAIVVWLNVAQLLANSLLVWSCLASFLAVIVYAGINGWTIPCLLFFLPWAALLKISPSSTNIYTIALAVVLVIYLIRSINERGITHIVPALLLIVFALTVKLFKGFSVDNSYIMFCMMLLLFPFVAKENDGGYDFYIITLFFSVGIILAALSSKQFLLVPTISRFFPAGVLSSTTRLSGYYGDPNFYCAQITAAISGVVILLLREKALARRIVCMALTVLLLYCGFLSVSKSFAIVLMGVFLVWILDFLLVKDKLSFKTALLISVIIGVIIVLSSTVFTDLIDQMVDRLRDRGTVSSFTTGRTDIWAEYMTELEKNTTLLLFGNGYSKIYIGDRAAHNILIQIVFQFGVVGSIVLIAWVMCFLRRMFHSVQIRTNILLDILILFVGVFGPWLALDVLFFDEFFLLQYYVYFGIYSLSDHQSVKSAEVYRVETER